MQKIICDKCGKTDDLKNAGAADNQWAYRKGCALCPECFAKFQLLEEKLENDKNEAINKFLGL